MRECQRIESKARPACAGLSACAAGRNAAPDPLPPRPQGHTDFAPPGVWQCDEGRWPALALPALVERKIDCGIHSLIF